MTLWAPEARRNTSRLVVATLRVALEVEGCVILVNPGKTETYVYGASIGIIIGIVATPGEQLQILRSQMGPIPPAILISNLLASIDVFNGDEHPFMSPIQRGNAEVQACVPMSSSKTIVSIRYRITEGTTIIYNVMM
jgi:hypothetical protein